MYMSITFHLQKAQIDGQTKKLLQTSSFPPFPVLFLVDCSLVLGGENIPNLVVCLVFLSDLPVPIVFVRPSVPCTLGVARSMIAASFKCALEGVFDSSINSFISLALDASLFPSFTMARYSLIRMLRSWTGNLNKRVFSRFRRVDEWYFACSFNPSHRDSTFVSLLSSRSGWESCEKMGIRGNEGDGVR
jgi:hypothetical protein